MAAQVAGQPQFQGVHLGDIPLVRQGKFVRTELFIVLFQVFGARFLDGGQMLFQEGGEFRQGGFRHEVAVNAAEPAGSLADA